MPRSKTHVCLYEGCAARFATQDQLESHVNAQHLKIRPFHCSFENCEATFTGKDGRHSHELQHQNPFGNKLPRRGEISDTEFIEKLQTLHGERYDYTMTHYLGASHPITFQCKTCKDFITKQPRVHITGTGCTKCFSGHKNRATRTTQMFVEEARAIHGDKYSYEKAEYKTCNDPILITCPKHGDFSLIATAHIGKHQNGCLLCSQEAKSLSLYDFITKSREVHNNKYDYYHVLEYKNQNTLVTISCPIHGLFEQNAGSHMTGSGCALCSAAKLSKDRMKSTESFVQEAQEIWGTDIYDYSGVTYSGNAIDVTIFADVMENLLQLPPSI